MKKIIYISVLFTSLLILAITMGFGNYKAEISAEIHADKVSIEKPNQKIDPVPPNKLVIVEQGKALLPEDANYLGSCRFDPDGNAYIRAMRIHNGQTQYSILRIAAQTMEVTQIAIPNLGQKWLMGFDLDSGGLIHALFQDESGNGFVSVFNSEGGVIFRFNTEGFAPNNIFVDPQGLNWITGIPSGGKLLSFGKVLSGETQLRIYDSSGALMGVPLGGLKGGEELGALHFDSEKAFFVSNNNAVIYSFAGAKFQKAREWIPRKGPKSDWVLLGVTKHNGRYVWYGASRASSSSKAFGLGFIGISDEEWNQVYEEAMLPAQYSQVAGIDHLGNLFSFAQTDGRTVLIKSKLNL